MELEPNETTHGFTVLSREALPEIGGTAYVGVHDASGARLLYLQNDDNNKSFAIGFRTPPKDDTGVFHILEHSVLCGSRKFPVKEPFVDLLKGSMQTFLNAMTFDDKTLYPVASTNEQDLENLMDVYLDAVFHPRIYEKRAIFEQEGWHYELRADEGAEGGALDAAHTKLVYNGVVFNEMKGALSDATAVLYDELQKSLFPDTCYAFESGGTPEAIPSLSYEEYLEEHRRHYRTDNSYIILYGNLDIEHFLAFLDEKHLSPVASEQRAIDEQRGIEGLEPLQPREISLQEALKADHAVSKMDTAPEKACSACGYVIAASSDHERVLATDILLDALFGSNEAPFKRLLLDAGIAHDVQASITDSILQPYVVVQLQRPDENAGRDLRRLLDEGMRRILDEGFDKGLVEAAISHTEFQMREHDFGYADGVVNAILALAGWLYDETAATEYLRYERIFSDLHEKLATDYFETLARDIFCNCAHSASVEIVPEAGYGADRSAKRLEELNRSLTPDQREQIVAGEARLRELQEAPDTPEAIATLPRLSVDDIGEMPDEPSYELVEHTPLPCLKHSVATRGIVYTYRYFDIGHLAFDDLPYLSVLSQVLGKLDTEEHSAAELDTLVQGTLGNLSFFFDMHESLDDVATIAPAFVVGASALSKNVEALAALVREVLTKTDFSNADKILDLLKQRKISLEQRFTNAGHSCATARCKSYYAAAGVVNEHLENVDFYRFVCELIDDFDQRRDQLAARLAGLAQRLFDDGACIVSFAGTDEDFERFWNAGPATNTRNPLEPTFAVPAPAVRNEAFAVPCDVCFAALGWDRRLIGKPFHGSWAVVSRVLSYDYLWNEVRVKGGAYGTGFQAQRTGNVRFYSYRDPHLDETIDRFADAVGWLADYEPSREDFEGFIVASVATIDQPHKPRMLIRRQDCDFFQGITPKDRRTFRQEVKESTLDQIRAFSSTLGSVVDAHAICAFGNRDILESSKAGLELITLVG